MFTRIFGRKSYTLGRARSLTAQFLRQHREAVAARIPDWDSPGRPDAKGAGRAPDGRGADRQTAADRYATYAVFLAVHVYGQCSPLLPQAGDEDEGIDFTGAALVGGLGLNSKAARDLFVGVLDELPLSDEDRLLNRDDIDGLSDAERRSVMLWETAAEDAAVVVRAFAEGRTTVDLSSHDFEPLAGLLRPRGE